MSEKRKKFEVYVFLSTFSRNLIEVFIPVLLYEFGYSLREVILYFFITNFGSLIFAYPLVWLSKKFDNKLLTVIGIISFVILQIMLSNITYSMTYLVTIGLLFAMYRRGYWIARRFYNLKVIEKEKIASTFSVISIINHLGVIMASYMGALMLDFLDVKLVTAISIILFIVSLIPLARIDFKEDKYNEKIQLLKTMKQIPKTDLYLLGSYELSYIVKFLFSLYIFIYIKDTYSTVGIYNLITNLSVLGFTYFYGKKIDNKKNFLTASIILVVITYIIKANTTYIALVVISFIEGIVTKMQEISISKEFYSLSKKFEYSSYNLVYEMMQNSFRSLVLLIFYITNIHLKLMIYITLFFILIGAFMKFKYIDKEDYKLKTDE